MKTKHLIVKLLAEKNGNSMKGQNTEAHTFLVQMVINKE